MTLKELLDRYGPTAAVVAAIALLVVLLPSNVKESEVTTEGGAAASGGLETDTSEQAGTGDTEVDAADPGGTFTAGGVTAAGNRDAGNNVAVRGNVGTAAALSKGITFGKGGPNCRPDGRQKAIAITAPPCSAGWVVGGDNGGSTSKGVTKDKILVVRFVSQVSAATRAALQGAGANDSPEDTARIYQVFNKYFNQHYETYGREVILVDYQASGPDDNEEAMRSDAIKIADEMKAFAVYNAPVVAAEELSQRKVICICTVSQSREFHRRSPYVLSALPVIEEYYSHIAEYWAKRLAGKNAKFSDDLAYQAEPRRFGLIWQEGTGSRVSPYSKPARDFFVNELRKRGIELTADIGYLYDLAKAGEMSTSIIAKMKSARVSTLVFIGEPLTPIFVTQEATRQAYFPEWFISGTALIDTTFFGRTYDPAQWANAFGISPLWVFWENLDQSAGYREFHHGQPGEAKGREGVATNVIRTPGAIFFAGVNMAGPTLTPDTFRNGLFSMPPFGGTPSVVKVHFSAESPTAVDDFTEVWWDPNRTGKDETDKQGKGALMKTDGGKRYDLGEWTAGDSNVFNASKSVYTTDNPPGGHHSGHDLDGHRHPPTKKCLSCAS